MADKHFLNSEALTYSNPFSSKALYWKFKGLKGDVVDAIYCRDNLIANEFGDFDIILAPFITISKCEKPEIDFVKNKIRVLEASVSKFNKIQYVRQGCVFEKVDNLVCEFSLDMTFVSPMYSPTDVYLSIFGEKLQVLCWKSYPTIAEVVLAFLNKKLIKHNTLSFVIRNKKEITNLDNLRYTTKTCEIEAGLKTVNSIDSVCAFNYYDYINYERGVDLADSKLEFVKYNLSNYGKKNQLNKLDTEDSIKRDAELMERNFDNPSKILSGRKMTEMTIDSFQRARHSVILELVAKSFMISDYDDIPIVSFVPEIAHTEFRGLTPDIVIDIEQFQGDRRERLRSAVVDNFPASDNAVRWIVIDVSVTEDVESTERIKKEKYGNLCDEINNIRDEKAVFYPLVFDPRSEEVPYPILFDNHFKKEIVVKLKEIKEFSFKLKQHPDYNSAYGNFVAKNRKHLTELEDFDLLFPTVEYTSSTLLSELENQKIKDDVFGYYLSGKEADNYYKDLRSTIIRQVKKLNEGGVNEQRHLKKELLEGRGVENIEVSVDNVKSVLKNRSSKPVKKRIFKFPSPICVKERVDHKGIIGYLEDEGYIFSHSLKNDCLVATKCGKIECFDDKPHLREGFTLDFVDQKNTEKFLLHMSSFDYSSNCPFGLDDYINSILKRLDNDDSLSDLNFCRNEFIFKVKNSYIVKWAFWVQTLAKEIMLSAGRRFYLSQGNSLLKLTDWGAILLKKGPEWSREKILSFKLFSYKNCDWFVNTHNMEYDRSSGVWYSDWFSANFNDYEIWSRVSDRVLVFLHHRYIKYLSSKEIEECWKKRIDSSSVLACMVMLEQRKPTSTSLQLNRYLFHSFTSYISDKHGILNQIGKDPIRSSLHNYVVIKQLEWSLKSFPNSFSYQLKWKDSLSSTRLATDYDRIDVPSFFNNTDQEVTFLMDEIYYGNLLNKENGYIGHKVKPAMKKLAEDEKSMREKIFNKRAEVFGRVDDLEGFLLAEDGYHEFDKKACYLVGKIIKKNYMNVFNNENFLNKITDDVSSMMTLKSSVNKSRNKMNTALEWSKNEERRTTFETQFDISEKYGTTSILEQASIEPRIDLYFGMFPKSQIGGPREIAIQDSYSRSKIKILESFMETLACSIESEMITKGKNKHLNQANLKYKFSRKTSHKKSTDSLMFYYNKDHSHWAPAMVTSQFAYMIRGMELPNRLEKFLLSVLMSFLSKKIALPPSLIKKWKDKNYEEKEEGLVWLNQEAERNNYVVEMISGWMQGMLNYTSSVFHCGVYDMFRTVIKSVIPKCNVHMEGLFSSDDALHFVLFEIKKKQTVTPYLIFYMLVDYFISKVSNLHINQKKSGINFIINEFNSVFMLGKRALVASIKDIFTVCDIPDLTFPEDSVKQVISYEKRLLDSGENYTTIELARILNSNFLNSAYRIDDDLISKIKGKLGLKNVDEIPTNLGILPCNFILQSLMVGSEYYIFSNLNRGKNKEFYSKLITSSSQKIEAALRGNVFTHIGVCGRRYIKLPTKLDKKMKDIKDKYIVDVEEAVKNMEQNLHLVLEPASNHEELVVKAKYNLSGMKSYYEIQDTIRMHSLVRALCLSRKEHLVVNENGGEEVKDVLSFIESILSCEEAVDLELYPTYHNYMELVDWTNKNHDNLCSSGYDSLRKGHPKMRSITMRAANFSPVCNSIDMLRYLEGNSDYMTRSVRRQVLNFLSNMNIAKECSFHEVAALAFPKSVSPKLDLWFALEKFNKFSTTKPHQMVTESPDCGSATDNMREIYKYRLHPLGPLILETDRAVDNIVEEEIITNNLCLCVNNQKDLVDLKNNLEDYPSSYDELRAIKNNTNGRVVFTEVLKRMMNNYSLRRVLADFKDRPLYSQYREDDYIFHFSLLYDKLLVLRVNERNSSYSSRCIFTESTGMDSKELDLMINVIQKEFSGKRAEDNRLAEMYRTYRIEMIPSKIPYVTVDKFLMNYNKDLLKVCFKLRKSSEYLRDWIKKGEPFFVLCTNKLKTHKMPDIKLSPNHNLDEKIAISFKSIFTEEQLEEHEVMQMFKVSLGYKVFDLINKMWESKIETDQEKISSLYPFISDKIKPKKSSLTKKLTYKPPMLRKTECKENEDYNALECMESLLSSYFKEALVKNFVNINFNEFDDDEMIEIEESSNQFLGGYNMKNILDAFAGLDLFSEDVEVEKYDFFLNNFMEEMTDVLDEELIVQDMALMHNIDVIRARFNCNHKEACLLTVHDIMFKAHENLRYCENGKSLFFTLIVRLLSSENILRNTKNVLLDNRTNFEFLKFKVTTINYIETKNDSVLF